MSIDHYYKKQQGKFVWIAHEDVEAEETPYYVSVNNNMTDVGYFFPTLEEATAFYEKEEKDMHEGCVGLYDHYRLIRGESIYGDIVHQLHRGEQPIEDL